MYCHSTKQSMVELQKRCWKTKVLQAFGDDEEEGYGAENLFLMRLRIDDLDESYGDDRHNNYQQPAPAVWDVAVQICKIAYDNNADEGGPFQGASEKETPFFCNWSTLFSTIDEQQGDDENTN